MRKSVLLWGFVCSVWGGAETWAGPPKSRVLKETPASVEGKSSGPMLRGKAPQPSVALVASKGLVKDGTPVAVIWSEDPGRALRRFLRVRALAPLEMLGPKVQEILAMVGPMADGKPAKDLESLFVQLPALLRSVGLELDQPATSVVYAKGIKVETLVSLGVDALKLERAFARWRLPVRLVWFAPELALLMAPDSRPVALIWKGRLYAMAGPDPNSVKMDAAGLGRLLDRVWSKQGDGMGLAASVLSDVSCPEQTDICAKVTLDMLLPEQANFPMVEAVLPWVKRYFRGSISSFDLREGIQAEQRFVMTKEFSPVLGILRSDTTLASWFSMLPITTGWFGRMHLSPKGIVRLLAFVENFHPKAKEVIGGFRKEQAKADGMAKQVLGTELTSVLKGLRGDVAGGFLWEDGMARVALALQNRSMKFFPGHLRGVFFALGFNTPVEAKGFLRLLFQAWSTVLARGPQGRGAPPVRVEKVSLFGRDALAIHLPGVQPVYLSTVQRFLFFFGHQATFGQFAAVWKGEAPSFAATDTAGVRTKRALELLGPVLDAGSDAQPANKTPVPTGLPPQELPEKPQGGETPTPSAPNANKKPESTGPLSMPVQAVAPRTPHILRDSFPGLFDYALMKTANAMVVHPRVLRDLGEWFVPPMFKLFARRAWSHLRLLGVYDLVDGVDYAYGWTLAFSEKSLVSEAFLGQRAVLPNLLEFATPPKQAQELLPVAAGTLSLGLPMLLMSGVSAAVAIPTYLRFARRAKTSEVTANLRAIWRGAIRWYDDEHADKEGNPMARHFPCEGKGWICAPKAMPCASGQALYTPNPAQWEHACWKQLRFSLNKRHYYRYCYKSEGTGVKSQFEVTAQGDLDCDGKYGTYKVRASVNPTTGEVEISKILKFDPLE
ncbi:hypothetical protein L6R29_01695 [Myxococcota bacterium]|nr:hypothetical protein [Myxococcota bacterium]